MVKRQQMRWALRGAHLLLQVRTRVLNDELADVYRRWYPEFDCRGNEEEEIAAQPSHGSSRSRIPGPVLGSVSPAAR
jgi:hypothetical protein